MKTIKPIKFSAENEQNAKSSQTSVNRMPPSGSGSGGSVKGFDNGGGHGTISSSYGGSWDVSCSFRWESELTYEKVEDMNAMIVTKAKISLSNIIVSCIGVTSGTKVDGKFYEPFNQGMNVSSAGCSSEDSSGLHDISCMADTSEEEFKVVIRKYDKDGKETSSETKCEKKRISMKFIFFINDYGAEPEIRLMSCELS